MPNYTSGSLSGAQLEIGIALVLQDRFSNQAREASTVIKQLHADAKNAVLANLEAVNQISRTVYETGKSAVRGLTSIVAEGAEYDDMMVTVQGITNATADQMQHLSDIAQTLGLKTMFDSKDIASGKDDLI